MSAFLAWRNFADAGSVLASDAQPTLPASSLQSPHIAQMWRSQSVPAWIQVDLGSSQAVNLAALCGVNATQDSIFRVRIGDDPDFATATYDSGDLAGVCDPDFGTFAHILAGTGAAGRYVRIDIDDASLDYLQAGRLIVSQGWRPRVNYDFGAQRSFGTLSKQSQSRSGQIYIDIGAKFRRWTMTFAAFDDAEAEIAETIDREVATDGDLFFCAREQSDNLGRDSIYGLVEVPSDLSNRAFRLYSKTYSIKARL